MIQALATITCLQSLLMFRCNLTDACMPSIAQLTRLTYLDIGENSISGTSMLFAIGSSSYDLHMYTYSQWCRIYF